MITLHETIDVDRPIAEAFNYVSDFRTAAEWDATAFRAEKVTPGPVAVGTAFDVACKLPVGHVTLRYTVEEIDAPHRLQLRGTSALFDVVDTILFSETESGTHIDYTADFTTKGPVKMMESAMRPGMERMGAASLAGMRRALNNHFPAPARSASTERADRLVVPGLALFSRLGYRRGRSRWHPISEWLGGRHIVITGASSGLGLATARRLAELGATLTLVMRNPEKAERVVADLKAETGNTSIRAEIADLELMSEVDALVGRLNDRDEPIHVLINNAGALFNPRRVTSEGLEASFALLLLSPYRLTLGLKPLLERATNARVVNVVSGGMYTQKLEVHKLIAREQNYSGSTAYARCKRALTVVTEQWAEAWASDGITVNAMHPGWADTPGVESALPGFHRLTRHILRTPEEGADTIIWLAASAEAGQATGELFLDREPRTKHLLSRTVETEEERERLRHFLQDFDLANAAAA